MNYELVKKLENADFVFKEHLVVGDGINTIDVYEKHPPTLSELIEACGEDFSDLERESERRWLANSMAFGSTPEEAVAHLWLALNESYPPMTKEPLV